jgi:hypothetical protein
MRNLRPLHRSLALIGVAAAVLAAAGPARAVTVTYLFAGVVTALTSDGGLFGAPGTVEIGSPFTGRITYETGPTNPDQEPSDPEIGAYALVELVIDQSVLDPFTPLGIGVVHDPPGFTIPPAPPDLGRDWFIARADDDLVYGTVLMRLQGPFGSAFTDDSLPETLDLADFPDVVAIQGLVAIGLPPNPSIEDVGVITSLTFVPEPGSAVLIGACLALLGSQRARARS